MMPDHQPGWCDGSHHKTLSPGRDPSRPPQHAVYRAVAANGYELHLCAFCAAWMRAELPECLIRLGDLAVAPVPGPWRDNRREWLIKQYGAW